MGWLISEKIHYLTRVPLLSLSLIIFAWAPIIFSVVGGELLKWFTGYHHDESNSAVVASGWLFLVTFPVAALGAVILFIVVIRDSILLYFN